MGITEILERGQFNNSFYIIFKKHGQYYQVNRRSVPDTRTDLQIFIGHIRQPYTFLIGSTLPYQSFAKRKFLVN